MLIAAATSSSLLQQCTVLVFTLLVVISIRDFHSAKSTLLFEQEVDVLDRLDLFPDISPANQLTWNLTLPCMFFDHSVSMSTVKSVAEFLVWRQDQKYGFTEGKHLESNILIHTFSAHVAEWVFGNRSAVHQMFILLNSPKVLAEGMLHGFVWQITVMDQASWHLSCSKLHQHCPIVHGRLFQDSLKLLCSDSFLNSFDTFSCIHGVGHAALLSALILNRRWQYEACQPLRYLSDLSVSEFELDSAIDACLLSPSNGVCFVCISGVYHVYSSVSVDPSSWLPPCDTVNRFVAACFLFSMWNYDQSYVMQRTKSNGIHPVKCLTSSLRQRNLLGCIYMAVVLRNAFVLQNAFLGPPTDLLFPLCDSVANFNESFTPEFRDHLWLVCISAYHASSSVATIKSSCKKIHDEKPQLQHRLQVICDFLCNRSSIFAQSRTFDTWSRYPVYLLEH